MGRHNEAVLTGEFPVADCSPQPDLYAMQGENERDRCLMMKYAFLKLVLPIWLPEMLDHNAPAAAATTGAAVCMGKRPQKRQKSAKQLQDDRHVRAQVLETLSEHFFIRLDVQQGPSRRGKAQCITSFTSYISAVKADDRQAMSLYWTEHGFGEHFALFHPPGLAKPFRFRRYDSYVPAMHAPPCHGPSC